MNDSVDTGPQESAAGHTGLVDPGLSQATFEPTPYEDATYEILGVMKDEPTFDPLELRVVGETQDDATSFFADYGGKVAKGRDSLWHLPEGVAFVSRRMEDERAEQEQRLADEIEARVAQARQDGYEQGKTEAFEQAIAANADKIEELQKKSAALFEDLFKQIDEHSKLAEQECVRLAVTVAEKLVGTAVEINPEYLIPLVNQAIEMSGTSRIDKVRVSPQDMEFIEVVGVTKLLKGYDASWTFESDPTIKAGCVMETSAGTIDFQIDQAWERIKDQVLKVIR